MIVLISISVTCTHTFRATSVRLMQAYIVNLLTLCSDIDHVHEPLLAIILYNFVCNIISITLYVYTIIVNLHKPYRRHLHYLFGNYKLNYSVKADVNRLSKPRLNYPLIDNNNNREYNKMIK